MTWYSTVGTYKCLACIWNMLGMYLKYIFLGNILFIFLIFKKVFKYKVFFRILWKFFDFNILNFSGRFRNLNLFFIKQIFLIFNIFFGTIFHIFSNSFRFGSSRLRHRLWNLHYFLCSQEDTIINKNRVPVTAFGKPRPQGGINHDQPPSIIISYHRLSSIMINHHQAVKKTYSSSAGGGIWFIWVDPKCFYLLCRRISSS